MLRDYVVHYQGKLVGIFRDYSEDRAMRQAWEKIGYSASKYSSAIKSDFIVQKAGIL